MPQGVQLTTDTQTGVSVAVVDMGEVKSSDAADIIDHIARLKGVKSVRTV